VRIERPDINKNRQIVYDALKSNYPIIFDQMVNADVLRYNFNLYQLEQMKKAQFVRLDNPEESVDLNGTYGFCAVDKNKEFSPLLVTPNLNIEIQSFTESYEQLMQLPNSEAFAQQLYETSDHLYLAQGYQVETIQNNMVLQVLIEHNYLTINDLSRERITEKVNREVLAVAKYVAVKKYAEHMKGNKRKK